MIALQRLLTQVGSSSSCRGGSSRGSSSSSSSGGSNISSRHNTMSVHMRLRLMIVMLTVVLIASHMSVDGLSTASDRAFAGSRKLFGGYRITPKFCRASKTLPRSDPRSHGPTICMFNHECTQRQGEVVGACMDGFLFGACCQIQGNDSPLIVEHELVHQSAAAQSYETYGLNNKRKPPTTPEALADDTATRAPVRRPPASSPASTASDSANHIVNSVGQFVYSASSSGSGAQIPDSGLDADSLNTIDGQLGNGYDVQADQFVVHHDAVLISSSAAPAYASRPAPVATSAPVTTTQFAADAIANSEYPTRIPTGPYADGADGFTPDHYGLLSDDILNSQSSEFTHSDITHPGVDAVIVGDEGADLATTTTITTEAPKAQPTTTTTTVRTTVKTTLKTSVKTTKTPSTTVTKASAKPVKTTHAKPSFRPKPTKAAVTTTTSSTTTTTVKTTTPVLYDTTSSGTGIGSATATGTGTGTGTGLGTAADTASASGPASGTGTGTATGTATGLGSGPESVGKPQGTMSDNDIESIESIILMLNDTKTGPQYNSSGSASTPLSQHGHHTTTVFDVLAHTKLPLTSSASNNLDYSSSRPPSTSYVYSPLPTRRPIQVHSTISSSYGAVQQADVQSSGFHSVLPSSESITEHILSITKRPVLLTAANFAATPKPQYTNRVPDEVTITGVSSVHTTYQPTNGPTPAKTKPPTSTTHKTTKKPTSPVTRQPQPPSTSYVTGPTTPRPSTVNKTPTTFTPNTRKPATSKPTNKINPQRKNQTEPSTVYIFRPTLNQQQPEQPQLVYEHVIQSKPIMQYGSGGGPTTQQPQSVKNSAATVGTSASSTTEQPHPTVLITPKPTANQVTSITWLPQSADTTQAQLLLSDDFSTPLIPVPSTSYLFNLPTNQRPASGLVSNNIYHITGGGAPGFGSTYAYRPSTTHAPQLHQSHPAQSQPAPPPLRPQQTISNDFEDPGYYAATTPPASHRPPTATPAYGEASTLRDEIVTANSDLNNFPPVRNPNLNITNSVGASSGGPQTGGAGGGILADDFEAGATPDFVEDAALNDKMGLLVSKIVESLQGNFEQLADVVYDDVVVRDPPTTKRPATAAAAASQAATRPTTRRPPATAAAAAPNAAKPASPSSRPTARPSAAASVSTLATKRPATAAKLTTVSPTKKPVTTNVKRTTRKPATTAGLTTRKPAAVVTKVPSTRKPTAKPTRKVIVTTTLQPAPVQQQQDEVVDEDDDDEDEDEEEEEEEEEAEEVVAANQAEPAEQSTPFAEGRIQCGIRPQVKSGRIVGGKGAAFGEFPWQVLVRESTWLGLFTKNKCGGVLISKNYVVTAAHCQPGFLASLVSVFGEFDISGELEAKRSVTKNVKRVLVHREYDAATFENDLALLELESPIHYDTHIVPICMPSDAADFTGRMATVTGWGRLKYGGGVPSVLQEVQVPVIENSVCQEMFHTAGHSKKILPSFLCAGYANGQKDSCEGDSGGPLVLQRQDGRWELAGTVSHGIKCAAPYLPGVYMRTTYYKPWLQSIAGVH